MYRLFRLCRMCARGVDAFVGHGMYRLFRLRSICARGFDAVRQRLLP
jgi:hypothetical protein